MKRLGQTLSPSPARQAPGPRGAEGNGEAGPSPHIGMAEGRPPRKTAPSPILLRRGREPTTARGRAMDTFMIEKQLEWRQETHDYLGRIGWGEAGGGGAWEGPMGQTLRSPEGAQSGASE